MVNAVKERSLPASTPYSGLKKVHVFGDIASRECSNAISSIILHQSSIEGLEIMCTSRVVSPGNILDPVVDLFSQPQLQFFVCSTWREYDFEAIFHQFLETNRDFEISIAASGHEVVIPACNLNSKASSSPRKVLKFVSELPDTRYIGIVFSWLQKVQLEVPLVSIRVTMPPIGRNEECFVSFLSSCQTIKFDCKQNMNISSQSRYDYFSRVASNPNLQALALNYFSSQSQIDKYLELLPSIFANSPHLKELSFLSNKLGSLPHEKLVKFFECLVSCPRPEQLSIDLRWNNLKGAQVDELLKVWRGVGKERQLKMVTLGTEDLQTKVEEMVLEDCEST